MRLNRYLAAAGFGSRRACEQFIAAGKVSINGHFIRDLATNVVEGDDVRVSGRKALPARHAYLAVHKPPGFVCTRSDEKGRRTIFNLVPEHFGRLFHVGRLDKESEGLLLLTNDGDLAQKLTHPSHEIDKEYEVVLDKPFDATVTPKFLKGFMIEGGRARMESVHQISPYVVKVILRQGLKRQIRLMFYRLGWEVKRLKRVRIGPVELRGLKPAYWRQLTAGEVAKLQQGATLSK